MVCVALGLTVTDAWCQSNFEAAGGRSFHNAQCKCADPTVALRNVDPALAAAAAANAAVAKQAVISEQKRKQKRSLALAAALRVPTSCRAVKAGISDSWCLSNCMEALKHVHSKRETFCPAAMCECS